MIRNSLNALINLWKKHWKDPLFILWNIFSFFYCIKIWRFILLLVLLLTLYTHLTILFKDCIRIKINRQKKISIILAYFKIKVIRLYQNTTKINKVSVLKLIILRNLFIFFLGIGYKTLKCVWSLYDCLKDEWSYAEIRHKKKNKKIIQTYLKESITNFIIKEFAEAPAELDKNFKVIWMNKTIIIDDF